MFNTLNKYTTNISNRISRLADSVVSYRDSKIGSLDIKEFNTQSDEFVIPGHIVTHKTAVDTLPTMFWCHGGPHGNSELANLTNIARAFNVNVISFDFRGSKILPNYYKNIEYSNYDADSLYYNSVERDYGGGHMHDLEAVVKYIKNNHSLDSEKFIIAGHSFGGYMVALALVTSNLSQHFKLGIACSGFYDLGNYSSQNCSFKGDWLRKAGPKHYANDMNKKIIIIHGGEGDKTTLVSRSGAQEFIQSLETFGKQVIKHFIEEADHFNLDFVSALNEVLKSQNSSLQELVDYQSSPSVDYQSSPSVDYQSMTLVGSQSDIIEDATA